MRRTSIVMLLSWLALVTAACSSAPPAPATPDEARVMDGGQRPRHADRRVGDVAQREPAGLVEAQVQAHAGDVLHGSGLERRRPAGSPSARP